MQTLKAGILYFALVFTAGFMLGFIRILWVVPLFGTRIAELMEMPIMLVVAIASASWLVQQLAVSSSLSSRLSMGLIALVLLLLAELTLVLRLRGLTLDEYFSTRDPVSGTVYYVMLIVFSVVPLLVVRE
ncbi:hypothetical protein [Myxosarcina sp. GI1(2024)]